MAPNKNVQCAGCSKKITNREYLACSLCGGVYDLECLNYSYKLFTLMSKDKKDNWHCPSCKSKEKKVDNTNTPVQSHRMQLNPAYLDRAADEDNVTLRKPVTESHCSTLSSPAASPAADDALLVTIRQEIQKSVAESVETLVKMFFTKEFNEIKTELVSLRGLRDGLEFLSADYDRIKSELKDSQEKMILISKENLTLTNRVNDLTVRLNLVEQHSREANIEINGVPENKSENIVAITRQLCKAVSIPLLDTDVLAGTRVRKMNEDNDRPRSIVIKLNTVKKRDDVLAAVSRFNKANPNSKLNTSTLGYGGKKTQIYVSEHLSPYNKALHASTRKAAQVKGFKYVWIRNGRIFVRKDDQAPARLIKDHDTLASL